MVGKSIEDLLETFADEESKKIVLHAVNILRSRLMEARTEIQEQKLEIKYLLEEIEDHIDTIADLNEKLTQIAEDTADKAMKEIEGYYNDN